MLVVGGKVIAPGAATIAMEGIGGNSSGDRNQGVIIDGSGSGVFSEAGGVFVIATAGSGNAPTALSELLRIIASGGPRPALIIGVPVGFVGAVEAKEELEKSGLTAIYTKGRKGGSTIVGAIVNALAILAGDAHTGLK